MEISSSKKKHTPAGIPESIFQSVNVMGDPVRSDAIEAAPAGTKSGKESKEPSPFGSAPAPALTTAEPSLSKEAPTNLPIQGEALKQKEKKKMAMPRIPLMKGKLLIIGGIVLVILLIIGGLYLYLSRFVPAPAAPADTSAMPSETTAMTEPAPAPEPPFSLDSANYLSFSTETDTEKTIEAKIQDAGQKIVSANIGQPVEFVVTDQNNNPLAFSRFAYLLGLDLPTGLLGSLDEGFSLFIVSDNGAPRVSLKLLFADASDPQTLLSSAETTLPAGFQNLLYGAAVTAPAQANFREGAYGDLAVRFVNVDSEMNYSFDYALSGHDWYIGSSKDALRKVLDLVNAK